MSTTREESLLNAIAEGGASGVKPYTREEKFLAYIAGETAEKPIAYTRKEKLLEKIAENGTGGGGGGGGTAKPEQAKTLEITENGEYKITPDSGKVLSSATAKVNVPDRYEEGYQAGQESVPTKEEQAKTVDITENGTTEVTPDEGKTLSKVVVNTNVASGGGGEPGKPYIDTSKMTDFSYFYYQGVRTNLIGKIDTSNGTAFSYMFYANSGLEEIPLFDTSKGTSFWNTFGSCSALKSVPNFDFSNGTNFNSTFNLCSSLETIPPLNLSKAKNFNNTFSGCKMLKSVTLLVANNDLMVNTFYNCTALTDLTIGEGWAVSIYLTHSTALTQESLHGMIENLADLTGSTAKEFTVGATNLAKIDEEHIAMLHAKNWAYS